MTVAVECDVARVRSINTKTACHLVFRCASLLVIPSPVYKRQLLGSLPLKEAAS